MMFKTFCLHFLVLSLVVYTSGIEEGVIYYKNSWVVEVPGGRDVAKSVADQLGFVFIDQVWLFENHFVFLKKEFPLRQRFGNRFLTNLLLNNEKVVWAEQQFVKGRLKKAFDDPFITIYHRPISKSRIHELNKTKLEPTKFSRSLESLFSWFGTSKADSKYIDEVSQYTNYFNDPMWNKQWYALRSAADGSGQGRGMDLLEVYKMNVTGRGVRVAIVDDGVDIRHPDLRGNYDADYSRDMGRAGGSVVPGYGSDGARFAHGTKCAGVVAMAANNSQCGVGVAFNARLAVIKMLDRPGVDAVEGQALRFRCEDIDVFSNSWGPGDGGALMENMGTLSGGAMRTCLQVGRKGKGSIYLFPAGNGKSEGDNCGADAYSNSLYVVTIASASRWGEVTDYSEQCSAIFTTTFSSGAPDELGVVTTGPDNECHNRFSSTSASVPIAAGIVALALEANGNLTHGDVKHLIVMSSEVAPLAKNENTWKRNGAGFWFSSDFGFGLMNAKKMVDLAQSWRTVPDSRRCAVSVYFRRAVSLKPGQKMEVFFNTSACSGTLNEVSYLEQLQVVPFIKYSCRGAISIHLTSPTGTTSTLLKTRLYDLSTKGLIGWPLKSVHFWGESPSGTWMIQTKLHILHDSQPANGKVKGFLLIFTGTSEKPNHYDILPRKYAPFTLDEEM